MLMMLRATAGIRTRSQPILSRPRLPDCATVAWRWRDSNPRPSRCERDALPTAPHPRKTAPPMQTIRPSAPTGIRTPDLLCVKQLPCHWAMGASGRRDSNPHTRSGRPEPSPLDDIREKTTPQAQPPTCTVRTAGARGASRSEQRESNPHLLLGKRKS